MGQQKFEKSHELAYAIPYGVPVHIKSGNDYIGGLAHEYRITIDRDGPGRWLVALELTLPSGPVRERTLEAQSLASAQALAVELRAEMQLAFATARGGGA